MNPHTSPLPRAKIIPVTNPGQKWTPGRKPLGRLKVPRDLASSVKILPRAIPERANPAYDQALRLIREDSKALKKEMRSLQPLLAEAEEKGELQRAEQLRKKIGILEVQSLINVPHVRWRFARGLGDMSMPVYRQLAEKRWRKDGALDLMMERVYQLHVVPDILPEIHPTLDLRVLYREPPPRDLFRRTRLRRRPVPVEPGTFLLPEQTRQPPRMYVSCFHPEPRHYTLVMLDPDYPDEENQSFKTYLHWIMPNVELQATTVGYIDLAKENYIPPHPQEGTPYHRYTMLLLQNPDGQKLDVDVEHYVHDRENFDAREFCARYGLSLNRGGPGGGVFVWREVWDPTVSEIYKDTLKLEEPRYGKMPKFDMYAEVKEMKRYL